jgi:hypothetical protein
MSTQLWATDKSQKWRERLREASQHSALDASNLQPWHWKLNLTIYDLDGKNPRTGSLEIWSAQGNMKSVQTLQTSQSTALKIGDKLYLTPRDPQEKDFATADFIEMQLLDPIPEEVFQPSVSENSSQAKAGQEKFDCIAPAVVKPNSEVIYTGKSLTFCLQANTPNLAETYEPSEFGVLWLKVGTFLSHQIPMELDLSVGKTVIADVKTVTLEEWQPDESAFAIPPEAHPFDGPVEISSGNAARLQIGEVSPSYPVNAKQRNASGNFIFDATIGKDGRISSLRPPGQGDPDLLTAAQQAISQWVYRPYLLNGVPVEIQTQIRLNFSMGQN